MSLKLFACLRHGKEHTNEWGWTYRGWDTEEGRVYGWVCAEPGQVRLPEFTTDAIRKAREEFAGDQIQSHRGGELSREYVELYPDRVRGMVKEGALSKKDVEKSKYVWQKDVKYWDRNKKHDAKALSKDL